MAQASYLKSKRKIGDEVNMREISNLERWCLEEVMER